MLNGLERLEESVAFLNGVTPRNPGDYNAQPIRLARDLDSDTGSSERFACIPILISDFLT
jgi:hypothetical protein